MEYLKPARYADLELLACLGREDPGHAFFLDFRGDIDPAPFLRLHRAFQEELLRGAQGKLLVIQGNDAPLPELFVLLSAFEGIEGDCFLKVLPIGSPLNHSVAQGGLKELLGYLFHSRNRHRAMIHCLNCESSMLALLQSLGFIVEGLRREEVFFHGKFLDIVPLSLTRSRFLGCEP